MLAMALSDVYEGLGKGYEAQAEGFAAKQGHFSMSSFAAQRKARDAQWEAMQAAKKGAA
jgi:isocitrate dehydrogenase kinase/phosphatase